MGAYSTGSLFACACAGQIHKLRRYRADRAWQHEQREIVCLECSFTIGGTKYMVLMSEDPESKLRGKCQGGGCSVNKTVTCLVVGIWKEPVPASACNRVVEALGEYLKDNNY